MQEEKAQVYSPPEYQQHIREHMNYHYPLVEL
jgi:hypothetical protein